METATETQAPPRLMVINREPRLRSLTYYGTPANVDRSRPDAPKVHSLPVHEVRLTPGINMVDAAEMAKTGVVPKDAGFGPVPGFRGSLEILNHRNEDLAYEVAERVAETVSSKALRELQATGPVELIDKAITSRLAKLAERKKGA